MLEGGGLADALPWVLAAVLAGETVGAAGSLPPRLRVPAAALAGALGLLLAALVSGVEPRLLAPAHWDELASGVGRGLEALSGVTLPYGGADPWPDVTLRLGGALLVTLAALLAAWPRAEGRGYSFFALAALLVLVATPITAIGTPRSLVLGTALAALTVCFLWLERLPLRPGIGVAVLGGHRARRRAAAERGGRPRRAVVRLPHVGRGPRHAGLGALRLGPLLRAAAVAARWARDAADQDRPARSTGSSRTSRTSTGSAGSCAARPIPTARNRRRIWSRAGRRGSSGRAARASPCAACAATRSPVRARPSRSTPARGARWRRSRPGPGRPTTSSRPASPTACASMRRARTGSSCRRPAAARAVSRATRSRSQLPLLRPELPAPGERSRPVTAVKLELRPFSTSSGRRSR